MSKDITWQKSSYSGGGDGNNCVEVAVLPEGLAIRESDEPDTVLTAPPARLAALLDAVREGGPLG